MIVCIMKLCVGAYGTLFCWHIIYVWCFRDTTHTWTNCSILPAYAFQGNFPFLLVSSLKYDILKLQLPEWLHFGPIVLITCILGRIQFPYCNFYSPRIYTKYVTKLYLLHNVLEKEVLYFVEAWILFHLCSFLAIHWIREHHDERRYLNASNERWFHQHFAWG